MKKKHLAKLSPYVRQIANELELRDWQFILDDEPIEPGAFGQIWPTRGRKIAWIGFCKDFHKLRPEQQRHTIVHELIHCHFANTLDFFNESLPGLAGKKVAKVAKRECVLHVEFGVDAMADAIAQRLPLPPKL